MAHKRNIQKELRRVFLLTMSLLFWSFCLNVIAQERKSNIIPGRVLVKFNFDEIELPEGATEGDVGRTGIRSAVLKQALQRFQVDRFAKVVPTAVKGDTIRVLPDGRTVKLADFSQLFLLRFREEVSVDSVVAALQKLDEVIYAEPDLVPILNQEPNDSRFADQWHLQQEPSDEDIDAPEAWDLSKGDGVKIAIVDLGVRNTHEDFAGKLVGGETTITVDPNAPNHGTRVAGVAGAATHNTVGVAGVGWNAKIIPYDHQNSTSGEVADILAATAAGADIINMSFSQNLYTSSLKDALDNAFAQGVTLVTAAGNDNPAPPWLGYPQAFDGMTITVSGTNISGNFRNQSNFGSFVDVAAPAQSIWTTDGDSNGDYAAPNGTSFSAPIVSGIVALLKAFEPNLIDRDFERIIELSAEDKGDPGWDEQFGYGRVNARQALDLVAANEVFHWTASGGSINSILENAIFLFHDLPGGHADGLYIAKRYHVIKTNVIFPQSFSTPPEVWGRVNGTVGYNPNGTNYSIPWCDAIIVDEFGTNLETYVYELWTWPGGSYVGFFPTTPENVQFAYTAFGTPGTPPLPPPPPQNLLITNAGSSGQNPILSWSASSGADSYNVYRCKTTSPTQSCQWAVIGSTTNTTFTDFAIEIRSPGQSNDTFHYQVKAVNSIGESSPSNEVTTLGELFFVPKEGFAQVPETFTLHQNFPNPFNPTTEIKYDLPENSEVSLAIYNLVGQKIRNLVNETQNAGFYRAGWNGKDEQGRDVASGIYIYRIKAVPNQSGAQPFSVEKKMTLLR